MFERRLARSPALAPLIALASAVVIGLAVVPQALGAAPRLSQVDLVTS
jgi:hypothetical protein